MNVHFLSAAPARLQGEVSVGRNRLEAVAEQFEAMFLRQLLKQMRKASDVLGADNPMRSRSLDTLRDMQDDALADELAVRRQTGIADMIVRQLTGEGAPVAPAPAPLAVATMPRMQASVVQPLAATWRRGAEGAMRVWEQGSRAFRALVDSVIAHESGGRIDAVSPRGARGLMHLMPATAREMAQALGLEYDEPRLLSDREYNKQLGTAYLGKMLERYEGAGPLAVAAYNAGPGRVDEWLQRFGDPRSGAISVAEWVERIPFKETRDYTRSILDGLRAQGLEPGGESNMARRALGGGFSAERFKPSVHPVALISSTDAGAPRSAAFAQSVRIVTEDLSQ